MYISPVSSFSLVKRNANVLNPNLNKNINNINYSFQTQPSFKGAKLTGPKDGIFQKIAGFFAMPATSKEKDIQELSYEEEMDNDIKDILTELYNTYKSYNKMGKTDYAILKQMDKLGAKFDYKGYIPYGDNKRLLFGDFDKETNRPNRADIISLNNGMQVETSYEFSGDFKRLTVTDRKNTDSYVRIDYINKKIVSMTDYDKEEQVLQRMVFLNNGIFYTYETTDEKGEPAEIGTIINYIFNDAENSYCIDLEDNGSYGYYEFNASKNMWEKKKSLSNKQIQEYL